MRHVFSFGKIRGLDAYLSPEMKSTDNDRSMTRALYKALQASDMRLQNYGTVLATVADRDKDEALPLIRRFYRLGFNIGATRGTARFLKTHGIRIRRLATENNVTMFTALDTVRVLLDVLEETTLTISTIDAQ